MTHKLYWLDSRQPVYSKLFYDEGQVDELVFGTYNDDLAFVPTYNGSEITIAVYQDALKFSRGFDDNTLPPIFSGWFEKNATRIEKGFRKPHTVVNELAEILESAGYREIVDDKDDVEDMDESPEVWGPVLFVGDVSDDPETYEYVARIYDGRTGAHTATVRHADFYTWSSIVLGIVGPTPGQEAAKAALDAEIDEILLTY